MKIKLMAALFLTILPVLAFAGVANAQTFRSGQKTNIARNENIDGSAWVAGTTVDVAGRVNGDLFCAGQNVTISGTIDGDVICAAQTLTISGTVSGDVRLAGQVVALNGLVEGSASVAAQNITMDSRANIGRDASFAGGSVVINGEIFRDLTLGSSDATLSAPVGRNISADVDNLSLNNGAMVGGTIDYTSPQKLTVNSGAKVSGKVTYTERTEKKQTKETSNFTGTLMWSLMLIASAVILALLCPRFLRKTTEQSVASFTSASLAIAVGLVANIILPVLLVLALFTVLAIPFAFVVAVAWLLVLLLSGVVTSFYLGRVIWRKQTNAALTILIGSTVLTVALMVPIVGFFACLLTVWFGSGAILLHLKHSYKRA